MYRRQAPDWRSTAACRPGAWKTSSAAAWCRLLGLYDCDDLKDAEPADRRRVLGGDHPDTLASRNNLAVAYECCRTLRISVVASL